MKMFDADETRMIGLPYDEETVQYVKPFSSNTGTSRTDGQNCYINIAPPEATTLPLDSLEALSTDSRISLNFRWNSLCQIALPIMSQ